MAARGIFCAQTPAQRHHSSRVLIAAIVYAAVLIPTVYVTKHQLVAGSWKMVLALGPAVPLIAMFGSYGRYLAEETDEYIRMMVVRQILTATTIAMVCAVVWGFLSDLGGAPPIATYWIAVIWVFMQGVTGLIDKVRG
jgi:hypothetical protein